jgi:hypothetical protein
LSVARLLCQPLKPNSSKADGRMALDLQAFTAFQRAAHDHIAETYARHFALIDSLAALRWAGAAPPGAVHPLLASTDRGYGRRGVSSRARRAVAAVVRSVAGAAFHCARCAVSDADGEAATVDRSKLLRDRTGRSG